MSLFKKAERAQTKLRLALIGPAGSGKTLSALKIARGLSGKVGKIAVIDSENGSASYYAGEPPSGYDFACAQILPPYTIEKYLKAIGEAELEGFDVIIVDSLSHAWAGEGGILQQKETMDSRGGNSFTNWGKLTPAQNKLVNAILHSKTNMICTMRSKTQYDVSLNEKGKAAPKKIGMAPVQRDGFEYEFDVLLDIDVDTHEAKASKDRTTIFQGMEPFRVTEQHGVMIKAWQDSATPSPKYVPPSDAVTIPKPDALVTTTHDPIGRNPSDNQIKRFYAIMTASNWTKADVLSHMKASFNGVESTKLLTIDQYNELCDFMEKNVFPRTLEKNPE